MRFDRRNGIRLSAVFCAFAFVVAASATSYAEGRCEALFSSEPTEVLALANLMRGWGEAPFTSAVELAKFIRERSSRFDQLMSEAEKNGALDEAATAKLLSLHHQRYFRSILHPTNLRTLRASSLRKNLANRGALVDENRSAWTQLRELSAQNARRIRAARGVSRTYRADGQILEILDGVRLRAHRNTESDRVVGGAVLSAERLAAYGLDGGLNSKLGFNREFLKSGDDVFFFVAPAPVRAIEAVGDKTYGAHSQVLKEDFARDHAWVSAFVMYPRDLAAFFAKAEPAKYDHPGVAEAIGAGKRPTRDYEASETAVKMLKTLHRYDLTFSDYEALVKDQLGRALSELKHEVPGARARYGVSFAGAVATIRSSEPHEFSALMKKLVMDPLGLDLMEAKVPVLVPDSAFE